MMTWDPKTASDAAAHADAAAKALPDWNLDGDASWKHALHALLAVARTDATVGAAVKTIRNGGTRNVLMALGQNSAGAALRRHPSFQRAVELRKGLADSAAGIGDWNLGKVADDADLMKRGRGAFKDAAALNQTRADALIYPLAREKARLAFLKAGPQ